MQFSNLNTQYNQINSDVIASITKENSSAAKSNVSSVYNSADLNLDAAVLSISSKGSAKMNAMLSKSIQLRATSVDPSLTEDDRRKVSKELSELRREMEEIRNEEAPKTEEPKTKASEGKKSVVKAEKKAPVTEVEEKPEEEIVDVKKMMAESRENIIKNANDSIQSQVLNRDRILQLL